MAKRFYIAATTKDTIEGKEKYYAHIIPVTENENLQSVLDRYKGLLHTNIMPTKKRASEVVRLWNDSYRENGTYLFRNAPFE